MSNDVWLKIGAKIVAGRPIDLDAMIFDEPNEAPDNGGCVSRSLDETWIPPATSIWSMKKPDRVCIGVRVIKPLESHVAIATRLVAMAVERGITPVIFSSLQQSGFERFGFRVERLAGADASQLAACEEELKRFWDIAVVVNAADIAGLG